MQVVGEDIAAEIEAVLTSRRFGRSLCVVVQVVVPTSSVSELLRMGYNYTQPSTQPSMQSSLGQKECRGCQDDITNLVAQPD